MKLTKIEDYFKGWVVGNFNPSLFKTENFEVAVKYYKKDDYEPEHYHKVATEITIITKGNVVMNGTSYSEGNVITIEPGESTDFRVMDDVTTTVIKFPCVKDDKYLK
jgi:quercetin dioxygenase-like cupin family protein